MTRSNPESEIQHLDSEIDRTFHRRLRESRERNFQSYRNMAQQQTLKELAAPDLNYQPLGINYPELTVDFELKSGLIHLLPRFHGLAGEDPNKHLHEFHIVCSTMRPQNITEEQIKLRAFPFSLEGNAKDWFFYLQPQSIGTWLQLKKAFLEKYFPASKAAAIRKEICGIRQLHGESLHEYWERFKKLCAACPHHQITEPLLIQYFYEGLNAMERQMIDAASGGALVNKTPEAARLLISSMAENAQQFGSRASVITKGVNEVSVNTQPDIVKSLNEMTEILKQIQLNQNHTHIAKICGICESPHHPIDMCPQLQGDNTIAAFNTFNNKPTYNNQPKPNYNTNTYNPNNRNHPNLSWTNNNTLNPQLPHPQQTQSPQSNNRYQPPHNRQPYQSFPNQQPYPQAQSSMEATLQKALEMLETTQCQIQEQQKQIKELHDKIHNNAQLTTQIPSQTVPNPKGCTQGINSIVVEDMEEEEWEDEEIDFDPVKWTMHDDEFEDENMYPIDEDEEEDPMEFMEEDGNCTVEEQEEKASNVMKCYSIEEASLLPEKYEDPGPYCIDCTIGDTPLHNCLCDPGAAANILPLSLFNKLGLEGLIPTKSNFIMANQSSSRAEGIVKDVIVSVEGMLFPADFYVMETKRIEEEHIILGRPFLKTARFELDSFNGTYSIGNMCSRMFYSVPEGQKGEVLERNSVFQYTKDGFDDERAMDKPLNMLTEEETVKNSLPSYLPHKHFKACKRSSGMDVSPLKISKPIKLFPCYLPHELYRKRKKRTREEETEEESVDSNQGTVGSLKSLKGELHPS